MKKRYPLYCLVLAALVLASCKKNNDINSNRGEDLVLTAGEQQKAEADNRFTLKLFKELSGSVGNNKNLVASPLSVSMAVAMTSNGSNGQTLEGIRTAMEFNNFTEAEINSYYHKLINKLPVLDPLATLQIANSIWYRKGFEAAAPFLQTNESNYDAVVEALDFNSPSAIDKINGWVKDRTNGKIPTIIDEISSNDVMFLINAIYFKSNWKYRFDKNQTGKGDFYTTGAGAVQADFMKTTAILNININGDVGIYELPYGNDKYSMVILLPSTGKSVQEVINTVDTAKWQSWTGNLRKQTVDIYLPKFKFSYNVKLIPQLAKFGMGVAFGPDADFTRINPAGGLFINKVIHKAFIEVNEEGTEAAAATVVGIGLTSAPSGPLTVRIDHPFIFAIREMKTGLILFAGMVNNPLLAE